MNTVCYSSHGLQYQSYFPQYSFGQTIISIIEIKGKTTFKKERIMPSNGPELFLNLGGNTKGTLKEKSCVIKKGDYVITGNSVSYIDTELPKHIHCLIVKFTNYGFNKLFPISQSEIYSSFEVNLHLPSIEKLITKLQQVESFQRKINILKNWADQKNTSPQKYSLVQYLEEEIRLNPFVTSKDLEQKTGYTAKYLNKKVKHYFGYTLSNYKRQQRFEKTKFMIQNMDNQSWQDILFENHYYDQSHFIKEIKQFSGLPPNELKQQLSKGRVNPMNFFY